VIGKRVRQAVRDRLLPAAVDPESALRQPAVLATAGQAWRCFAEDEVCADVSCTRESVWDFVGCPPLHAEWRKAVNHALVTAVTGNARKEELKRYGLL